MRRVILILLLSCAGFAQEVRRPSVSSPVSIPNAYDASGTSTSSSFGSTGNACSGLALDGGTGRWSCNGTTGSSVDTLSDVSSWASASGPYSALVLKVQTGCSVTNGDDGNGTQNAFGSCTVSYSINSGSTWTTIRTSSSGWATVTDSVTLSASQTLSSIQVRFDTEADGSTGGGGVSAPSPASSTITITDTWTEGTLITVPATPTGLTATPANDGSTVSLAWTDNATNEDSYKVQRCSGASCTPSDFATGLAANSNSYLNNTSVTTNTRYGFAVCAVNAAGAACSSTVFTDTLPAPTGLGSTALPTSVALSWTDNSTIETSYKVQKCTGSSCTVVDYSTGLAANSVTFNDTTGVSPLTTYRYAACAVGSIVTACSSVINVTTPAAKKQRVMVIITN